MSDYTPIEDFSAKDALSTGDPDKLILGVDIDAETAAIQTAIATKYDSSDLATQGQAEAGTDNTVLITPLRMEQSKKNAFVYKTANENRGDATLAIDADLQITLAAGTWAVSYSIPWLDFGSTLSGGFGYQFKFSPAGTSEIRGMASFFSPTADGVEKIPFDSRGGVIGNSGAVGGSGVATVSESTTFSLWWSQHTLDGGEAVLMKAGAWIHAQQIA